MEKIRIDLNKKIEEAESQEIFDLFWIRVTPKWFEWLGWVLILGVISYLSEITENVVLKIAHTLSYLFLFFYLQGIFYRIEVHGIPFVRTQRIRRLLSLAISASLAYGIWYVLFSLVNALKGKL